MESVYFGKEITNVKITDPVQKPQGNTPQRPREYYFPNENTKKLDIIAFISALLASAVLDGFIFGFAYPAIIFTLRKSYPVFKLIIVNEFLLADIFVLYAILFIIIYFLIHNSGRKKVYVNDNGTFYFLKMNIRVKTGRSNSSIHAKYARYINKANKQIEKRGLRIFKVLTDCKESDNIHDDGIYFTGFNEKTVSDEEFKIPGWYIKYEPNADYHKNKIGFALLFWVIKLSYYGIIMCWLISIGKSRLNTFNECFETYRDERIAALEPIGYKYLESSGYLDHTYEYLEFIDKTDNLNNTVRVYFDITKDGEIIDDSYSFFYDMNYDEDIDTIKTAIRTLYDGDIPELDDIDEMIQKYKLEGTRQSINISNDHIFMGGSVYDSYYADYSLYINFSEKNKLIYIF